MRVPRSAEGENALAGGGALYAIRAVAIVVAFTVATVAAEDDDEPVSA